MDYWRERLPAIRGIYAYLLPVLIAVTPVLGTCGISKCCGLRSSLKPSDYDIELSRNVSGMFQVGVTSCPLCAQENREWMRLITVKDDEEAMDRLYGKIGYQLFRVISAEEADGIGILCLRFVKWLDRKRIGCFIYEVVVSKPKNLKNSTNLKAAAPSLPPKSKPR